MDLFEFALYLHSYNRYLLIAVLVVVVVNSLRKFVGQKEFVKNDHILSLIAMSSAHCQWLIGIYLYFSSPLVLFDKAAMKVSAIRYWTTEHIFMMMLAVLFITLGRILSKRSLGKLGKEKPHIPHRLVFVFNGLALALIAVSLITMMRIR